MEAGKGRKGRRTVRRIHADLVALGYGGSYARVAAFVRRWQAGREIAQRTTGRGVFVLLAFQPGEAFQFDWSEDWATVGGKRLKLQAAHTKLSHSRAFVIRAYKLQTHEMLFNALAEAFRKLQAQLLRRPGGDREMVDILALVLQHDEGTVLCAVELALEGGVATKTHVLNILHCLTDGTNTATVLDAPQALVLSQEPRADIGRYDALRDREVRHAS